MTAGGNYNVTVLLLKHTLIFVLDYRRTDSSLLNVVKTELFKSATHGLYTYSLIVSYKGGCKADYNGISTLKQDTYLFGAVNYLLCILRTNDEAVTAKNTLVSDYMSLVTGKADRFNRTVSDTLITVFTVGFF